MDIKVDYKLKNALDFNAKEYLADMLAKILMQSQDAEDFLAEYILDAWSSENFGLEKFEADVEELLDNDEMGETIRNFLINELDINKEL
tara:strand:- start:217 stop:483 length:267 start_codon:yes stop_codon:yes gene_type:complete